MLLRLLEQAIGNYRARGYGTPSVKRPSGADAIIAEEFMLDRPQPRNSREIMDMLAEIPLAALQHRYIRTNRAIDVALARGATVAKLGGALLGATIVATRLADRRRTHFERVIGPRIYWCVGASLFIWGLSHPDTLRAISYPFAAR